MDIFAGPGGLGEGFASFEVQDGAGRRRPFKIAVAAEKDSAARNTLALRAFYRRFETADAVPDAYYEFVRGERTVASLPPELQSEWVAAQNEALLLELGPETARLHEEIRKHLVRDEPWVLVGGPPCQAYSLAGRSRNKGKEDYVAKDDHRHFLYREYLQILSTFEPPVFIMENVKGILTSSVEGKLIFETILEDLHDPRRAIGGATGPLYDIHPLSADNAHGAYPEDADSDASRFLIRSEDVGIPQARHRVILLGIKRGATVGSPGRLRSQEAVVLDEVINDLPKLRSGLSKSRDSVDSWLDVVEAQRRRVLAALRNKTSLATVADAVREVEFIEGGERSSAKRPDGRRSVAHARWYLDARLGATLNHSSRGHMADDLGRYLYCAVYASCNDGRSPISTNKQFPFALAPSHVNWASGDFPNRFRVQAYGRPASTVVSHISKDGHYYIHPDAAQCRSFTVREAARAQTFPDNYFFTGGRTEQYVQVGNAVPPLLARQIAEIVWSVLDGA